MIYLLTIPSASGTRYHVTRSESGTIAACGRNAGRKAQRDEFGAGYSEVADWAGWCPRCLELVKGWEEKRQSNQVSFGWR